MDAAPTTIESKKDYSGDYSTYVSTAEAMEDIDDAIAHLLGLEKLARTNNDFNTLKRVAVAIIKLCRDRQDWGRINSSLNIVNKRRSQSKHAISSIVAEAMGYLNDCPTREIKVALIQALKDVCDTKIYVEGESAKLHMMLAHMREEDGDINSACEEIQDVHVETYGSLSKLEKCAYINEQVRLNLKNNDYIRAKIHSRKMNRKTIDEKAFADIKFKYYSLMIDYHLHERETRDLALSFEKLFEINSDSTFEEEARWKAAISDLETALILFVVSPLSADRTASLANILNNPTWARHLEASPLASELLRLFTTDLIIPPTFDSNPLFAHASIVKILKNSSDLDFLKESFSSRRIEHNIRVVYIYYSRISLNRLATLVGIPTVASSNYSAADGNSEFDDSIEDYLAKMSHESTLGADLKIDRPLGTVVFTKRRANVSASAPSQEIDALENWSSDISSILKLVETTCHLIRREYVIHKVTDV